MISKGSPAKGRTRWDCLCDCGSNTLVHANNLKNGRTKSCGCLKPDEAKERLNLYPQMNHVDKKRYMAFRDKLYTTFRIREKQYLRMMDEQRGCCPICQRGFEYTDSGSIPCIDHNHTTGKVRGILCGHCNRGIGCLRDSTIILQYAIKYLEGNNE